MRLVLSMLGRPAMLGWVLAGLMALTGGAYTLGRHQGATAANANRVAEQARLQTQMNRAAEVANRKEAARLTAEAKVEHL